MCSASKKQVNDIARLLILLQLWAWDMFPCIALCILGRHVVDPIMDLGGI